MTVSVTTGRLPVFGGKGARPTQTMDGARFQFTGARDIPPQQADYWWASVEPEAEERFRAWIADPPRPTPFDISLGDLAVSIPIPSVLLTDPEYDLVSEVLPEIQEAATTVIRDQRGWSAPIPQRRRA